MRMLRKACKENGSLGQGLLIINVKTAVCFVQAAVFNYTFRNPYAVYKLSDNDSFFEKTLDSGAYLCYNN